MRRTVDQTAFVILCFWFAGHLEVRCPCPGQCGEGLGSPRSVKGLIFIADVSSCWLQISSCVLLQRSLLLGKRLEIFFGISSRNLTVGGSGTGTSSSV
jgi:hypothetical protein